MESPLFSQLPISQEVLSALADMGFTKPSPIQARAIPIVIEGNDVVGQAQTGTGKTIAFGIPVVEKVTAQSRATQALVLCPTRELAVQIAEEIKRLLTHKPGINVLPIYGGQPIERQYTGLRRGAQIVIGTPGRVMDHLDRGTLKLNEVSMIVLDEADEMLDRGFREDIETILRHIPENRQTIFFSATMSKAIMDLTKRYQTNPQIIRVERTAETAPKIEQVYVEVREHTKFDTLCRFLDVHNHKLSVIFCKTKRRVSELVEKLHMGNYLADCLHGDMKQASRDAVMDKFRRGSINILVATDVAARGIDVENVEAVFNYDLPHDTEYYLHRIGRTGRAGKSGISVTFASGREVYSVRQIQNALKTEITQVPVPSNEMIINIRIEAMAEKLALIKKDAAKAARYSDLFDALCSRGFEAREAGSLLLAQIMGANQPAEEERSPERKSRGDRPERGERSERGERGERPERRNSTPRSSDQHAVLQLNVGKSHRIRTNDIVGAIAGETGLSAKILGAIQLTDMHTFVEVPHEHVDTVIQVMGKAFIKGNKTQVKRADEQTLRAAASDTGSSRGFAPRSNGPRRTFRRQA